MAGNRLLFDIGIGLRAASTIYSNRRKRAENKSEQPTDIFLCIADHYEPQHGRPERSVARRRVEDWLCRYPDIASRHHDAEGRIPAHSFFYPWDEYDAWEMERLSELCAEGYGEIELHLHHKDDTDTTLRIKLREALRTFRKHQALASWPDGRIAFGFIHGNWALDNSRYEQGRNYCGVNNELMVLREEGCYADFTFPAWQHTAQPRQTNSIYYAIDDPSQPKSYDRGIPVSTDCPPPDGLLLIQGALTPGFRLRRGVPVTIDDSDLASYRRYTPERLDRWIQAGIHVRGRPDRIFIKLHCHGAADSNREALLGNDLDALFSDAETRYNDGTHYRLHYVTAREMFNIIKATEANSSAEIAHARDWILSSSVPALCPVPSC